MTIERVTGIRPMTCPWRAFSDPLVREVLDVTWATRSNNLAAAIGTDAPHVFVQAIGVYERSLLATQADERKIRDEERASEQRTKAQMRKALGRG